MRRARNIIQSKPEIRVFSDASSSSSGHTTIAQEHARPRAKYLDRTITSPHGSTSDTPTSASNISLSSSITRFRNDFDELQCKMQIFGESLNLCRCIADDFKNKLSHMEKRLVGLEKRQIVSRSASNYSAIIQKNKKLSTKTLRDAKKLQMCGTEEEMRVVAGRICRNYLHGSWKTVKPEELEFKRISGGLSNFLYYVALPEGCKPPPHQPNREPSPDEDSLMQQISKPNIVRCNSFAMEEPRKVLLRIYGQVHGERAMDAIVTESVIFTLLSERRLGPKLYGVFSGGRIEEYIPARPLLTKELAEPALSMKIAEKMAAIHSMDIPLSKEPNWLWKTMAKWLKIVKEERLSGSYVPKNEDEKIIIKELKGIEFEKEIEWLKKYVATVDSPVLFCHNDMQEGNILIFEDTLSSVPDTEPSTLFVRTFDTDMDMSDVDTPIVEALHSIAHFEDANTTDSVHSRISDSGEPRLVLIDFEYCAYNYRGFDIANHFQEWGYDYTNPVFPFYFENQENTPTLEQKEIFIREYLKHHKENMADNKDHHAPSIEEVNHLLNEIEAFALASHLFWGLWSIVNASKSQIPFGYWEYALSRLEVYKRLKQEVIKKDKYGMPQKRKICEVDI